MLKSVHHRTRKESSTFRHSETVLDLRRMKLYPLFTSAFIGVVNLSILAYEIIRRTALNPTVFVLNLLRFFPFSLTPCKRNFLPMFLGNFYANIKILPLRKKHDVPRNSIRR